MKKLFVIIIFTFSNIYIFANDTLTFQYVDSATYSMYQKQEWKSIITLGNNAIYNNIDYFYLRMRIGIAYYELKEYTPAISHFEKALEFNSADEVAMEYKYYSLLNSAKTREAGYYAKTFPQSLIDKIKPEIPKKIDKIIFEGGFNIVPGFDTLKTIINPPDQKNYRLEKDVTGKFIFAGIGVNHELNKKLSIFHSFNFLQSQGFQQLYYNYNIANQNNYILNQLQYYFAPTYYGKKNNATTLFANVLYLSSNKYKYTYTKIQPMPPPLDQPIPNYSYKIDTIKFTSLQYVLGFNYLKNYKNNLIDITATYSNLNSLTQIELTTCFGFYANKQKTIFSKTNVTLFSQRPDINLIFSQLVKIKLHHQLWLDIYGNYGKQRNFNENSGYIVQNTNDETLYRIGAKLTFPIFRKLNFYLSYSYSAKVVPLQYIYFTGIRQNKETFQTIIKNYNYNQHLIYGGLIWKF